MKKHIFSYALFVLLAFGAALAPPPAAAQDTPGTVKFPAAADSADSLIRASNSARSTLSGSITTGATTITVVSTASFPVSGAVMIDSEIIFYTGKTSDALTGVTRGADSTTAASHASGAAVRGVITAAHHNTLSSAVRSVEGKVGTGESAPVANKVLVGTGPGTSAWGTVPTGAMPSDPNFSGNASVSGNLNVGGVITGNCAGCTGLTGATGGISNTGSTTARADSDSDGVGVIDLQVKDGKTGLRVNNDATVTAPVGGNIPDLGSQVFNVVAYGAKCDGATNDTTAVLAAVAAAEAAWPSTVYFPGKCVVRQTVTVTKSIKLQGAGPSAGLYADTTFTGTDLLKYRPTAFPYNEKFTIESLTLSHVSTAVNPLNQGEWWCTSCPSTLNAFHIDSSGVGPADYIHDMLVINSKFLPTGGWGIVADGGNNNGTPAKSLFSANVIFNGVKMLEAGDSVEFSGQSEFKGKNRFEVQQVNGATHFTFRGNNFTMPGGMWLKGNFVNGHLEDSIFELYKFTVYGMTSADVGHNGAIIDLDGTGGTTTPDAWSIMGNTISSLDGSTYGFDNVNLDGIRIGTAASAEIGKLNRFKIQAGKQNINATGSASNVIVDFNRYVGGALPTNDSYGAGGFFTSYLYTSTPSSNALAAGLRGNLSIAGVGQFGGVVRASITPGAAGLGSFCFNESGTDTGCVRMPAAAFSDATRSRDLELFTLTNGAGVSFSMTTGGTTSRFAKFFSTGDLELFTSGQGVILHSPDGTRYRLTVSNAGAVVVTAAP